MKINPKVNIDPAAILRTRGLGDSSAARKHLANTVRRLSDPYVPMQQNALKDSAQIIDEGRGILYNQPYAHYQYVGEIMGPNYTDGKGRFWSGKAPKKYTGRDIKYHGGQMRGKQCDKRMMANRGEEVVEDLANFVGGKRK